MNDDEKKIRQAIKDMGAGDLDGPDQGMWEMFATTLRGKQKWWMVLISFWSFVFFAASIFVLVRFFQAETTKEMVGYAMGVLVFMQGVGMMKIWVWMAMNRNSILREVKRLEVQVARLANNDQ